MKVLAYIYTFRNKNLKKDQYSVVVANESGKEISCFIGDVDYSPDLNALNRVLSELKPTEVQLFTKSEKFCSIINNKKFENYNSPEWGPLKTFLINNIFDEEYESNGYFYTYDDDSSGSPITYEGTGYYPQAGINFLVGATLKF